MNILLLILSSGLLVSVGFFFVVKGLRDADEEDIVPISDVKELKELKKTYVPDEKQLSIQNSITNHLLSENIKKTNSDNENVSQYKDGDRLFILSKEVETLKAKLVSQEKTFQGKIDKILKEKNDLNDALKKEVSSKMQSDTFFATKNGGDKKNENALDLEESIKVLKLENAEFISQLSEKEKAMAKLQEEISDIKKEKEIIPDVDEDELNKMRYDIVRLQDSNDKLSKNNSELKNRLEERESLENTIEEKDGIIIKLQQRTSALMQELDDLKSKGSDSTKDLEMENRSLKAQVEERENIVKELQAEIKYLEGFVSKDKEADNNDSLRSGDQDAVSSDNNDSANKEEHNFNDSKVLEELEELKEHNKNLVDREMILQYELTKNRAQSAGLDKICKELKVRIEKTEDTD